MSAQVRKPSKYRAQPTVVDGIRFASQKEARRYGELKLLEKAGEISDVRLQPPLTLEVPWIYGPDKKKVIGYYRADFVYYDIKAGRQIVEDVKGFRTPLYKWKKKHVEAQYGITIREV